MKKNLARNAVSWPIQGGQEYHLVVMIKDELIKTRPLAVTGLLKGVIEAEDFLKKDEDGAQAIVERSLGLDRESVVKTWAKTRFRVRLDQSLLTLLEDEGRWAIRNKLVDGQKDTELPQFSLSRRAGEDQTRCCHRDSLRESGGSRYRQD